MLLFLIIVFVSQTVRQHALSILTDAFLDKQTGMVPAEILCEVLGKVCIPLAAERIVKLRRGLRHPEQLDNTMVEVELCVSLIFKPLRHHMKSVVGEDPSLIFVLWMAALNATKEILEKDSSEDNPSANSIEGKTMVKATNEVTVEHLQNVIMVLISFGVLKPATGEAVDGDLSSQTWSLIDQMEDLKKFVDEWKGAALNPPTDQPVASEEEQ